MIRCSMLLEDRFGSGERDVRGARHERVREIENSSLVSHHRRVTSLENVARERPRIEAELGLRRRLPTVENDGKTVLESGLLPHSWIVAGETRGQPGQPHRRLRGCSRPRPVPLHRFRDATSRSECRPLASPRTTRQEMHVPKLGRRTGLLARQIPHRASLLDRRGAGEMGSSNQVQYLSEFRRAGCGSGGGCRGCRATP
jgi:hypothetical protein